MQVEDIRTVMIDGEKWYVGIDVAKTLGYVSTSAALQVHVDDKDQKKYKILIDNKKYDKIIINKHGLESWLSSCQNQCAKIIAKKFNIRVKQQITKITKAEGIRIVIIDGKKWYVGRDVAKALGYVSPSSTIQASVDNEDKKLYKISTNTGKHYRTILINKHGLESLVSSCTLPNAINIAQKFNISVTPLNIYKVKDNIRIVMLRGKKWYIGKDVAKALGYLRTADALNYNVSDQDKKLCKISTNNGMHYRTIVNKHGLESWLSSCQKPNAINIAKKFNIKVNKKTRKQIKVEDIRTVIIDGKKWYVGRDVAKALGYVRLSGAIQHHVDDKDKTKGLIRSGKQNYSMILINKHGLESLVSSCTLPNALDIAKKLGIKVNKKTKKHIKVEDIRKVIIDGEKWYVGVDTVKALGYKGASSAIQHHVDDKDKKKYKIRTSHGMHYITIINKHGLESLVSSCTMPNTLDIAEKLGIQLNYILDTYKGQNIRNIIINGKSWFIAKDVVKILGYKRFGKTIYKYINKEDIMSRVVISGNHGCKMILINKHGLESLVSSCTLPNALDIAKKLGINVNHILNTRKEQDSIHAILKAFKGERMVRQYSVGTYRIDLYFPDYKLAIECDEFGHSDRDQEYEQTRQHYIEDKLGCKFIRYNPDSKDYNIFNVLNKIYKEIGKN